MLSLDNLKECGRTELALMDLTMRKRCESQAKNRCGRIKVGKEEDKPYYLKYNEFEVTVMKLGTLVSGLEK